MNSKNHDVDVYVKNVLKTHGGGLKTELEGNVHGAVSGESFNIPPYAWVDYDTRSLIVFGDVAPSLKMEIKQVAFDQSEYDFDMGRKDFCRVDTGSAKGRWEVDKGKILEIKFDSANGKLSCRIKASVWRGHGPDQETGDLDATLNISR